jgi:hypothetical protein
MPFIHNITATGRESIEATGDDAGFNPLLSSIFVDGAHGQPGR